MKTTMNSSATNNSLKVKTSLKAGLILPMNHNQTLVRGTCEIRDVMAPSAE